MPRPFKRSLRPDCEPAGMRRSTVPASVGTGTVAPSAASHGAIGSTCTTLRPSRRKRASSRTPTSSNRSPFGPPDMPGCPCPDRRITCPGLMPAGIFTCSTRSPLDESCNDRRVWPPSNAVCRSICTCAWISCPRRGRGCPPRWPPPVPRPNKLSKKSLKSPSPSPPKPCSCPCQPGGGRNCSPCR